MNWSKYQTAIYEAFEHGGDSLLIEAVAGSGKTTVLMELARIMQRAMPQQRGVFLAFNKSIAVELQRRIDEAYISRGLYSARPNVQAMTLHSAGWAAWRRAGGLDWEPRVDSYKVSGIMREVLSYEENKRFGETTRKLVSAAKGIGLVPRTCSPDFSLGAPSNPNVYVGLVSDSDETWESLMDHYSLAEDECSIPLVRKVLARSIELARESCDFDDMLYMPVVAGVPFDRYDVVLVDEAQDVSGIQMEMIARMTAREHAGGPDRPDTPPVFMLERNHPKYRPRPRIIAVGDRAQAIYGFRGAGTTSMDEMKRRFQMRELPLSVTYRCLVAVVEHAKRWVPQIEAREGAEWGIVLPEGTDWRGQAEVALGSPLDAKPRFASAYGVSPEKYREMARDVDMTVEEAEGLLDTFQTAFPKVASYPGGMVGGMPAFNKQNTDYVEQSNREGITKWRGIYDFQPGDAILCRLTRPLVAAAFTLIRNRVAGVHVLGKDIAGGLVALVKKSKKQYVVDMLKWLEDYQHREGTKLRNRGKYTQAGLLDDRCDTVRVFCEQGADDATVEELVREIERLFVDANGGTRQMITLATVHKAKGLEWERVFVLDAGEFMPCPWARGNAGWEMQQERNLMYVAATRAVRELRYITTGDLR